MPRPKELSLSSSSITCVFVQGKIAISLSAFILLVDSSRVFIFCSFTKSF